jgi:hypothetical protein
MLKNETSNKKYYCCEVYQIQQITTLHTECYTVREIVVCAPLCTAARLKALRHDTLRRIRTISGDKSGTSLDKVEVHKYKLGSVHYTFSGCFHTNSQ